MTINKEAIDKMTITPVTRMDRRIPTASRITITDCCANRRYVEWNDWPNCMQVATECQSAYTRSNCIRHKEHPACDEPPPVAKHASSKLVGASRTRKNSGQLDRRGCIAKRHERSDAKGNKDCWSSQPCCRRDYCEYACAENCRETSNYCVEQSKLWFRMASCVTQKT